MTKAYALVRSQVIFTIEKMLQMVLVGCWKEVIFPRLCLYLLWVFWRLVCSDEPVCRGSQFMDLCWIILYSPLVNPIVYISQYCSGGGVLVVSILLGISWLYIRHLSFKMKSARSYLECIFMDFSELDEKLYEHFSVVYSLHYIFE